MSITQKFVNLMFYNNLQSVTFYKFVLIIVTFLAQMGDHLNMPENFTINVSHVVNNFTVVYKHNKSFFCWEPQITPVQMKVCV